MDTMSPELLECHSQEQYGTTMDYGCGPTGYGHGTVTDYECGTTMDYGHGTTTGLVCGMSVAPQVMAMAQPQLWLWHHHMS